VSQQRQQRTELEAALLARKTKQIEVNNVAVITEDGATVQQSGLVSNTVEESQEGIEIEQITNQEQNCNGGATCTSDISNVAYYGGTSSGDENGGGTSSIRQNTEQTSNCSGGAKCSSSSANNKSYNSELFSPGILSRQYTLSLLFSFHCLYEESYQLP
jgi:hypothetical protein